MIYQDPRDDAPEVGPNVEIDPKTTQDRDKEIKTKEDATDGSYQYTDWASI